VVRAVTAATPAPGGTEATAALPLAAVDIGGTKIAVGIVAQDGRVLARAEMPTDTRAGFNAAMERVAVQLASLGVGRGPGVVAGIGIGCSGPVDPRTGLIGDVGNLPGWRGANPAEWLAERFAVTTALENDADAFALAEHALGAGRGCESMLCVTVGTGIGAGIVMRGQLYRGVDGSHPEVGHHMIDATGPACYCGAPGCWEVLASGTAMTARARDGAPPGADPAALPDARRICDLAREGDPWAREQVALEARYLGLGLSNLVTMFSPECIVLSGSVMESADLFMPSLQEIVLRQCTQVPAARVRIMVSPLGRDASLIGAAMAWPHRQRQAA
jgi:glucokinase